MFKCVALCGAVWLGLWTAGCGANRGPSAAEGRALYAGNGCASCHGATGHGDGQVAAALPSPPRDFRERAAFTKGTAVATIATALAEGFGPDSKMPLFPHLMGSERQSLAMFVLELHNDVKRRISE